MTNKYHISPTTGRPNKCKATVQACPYGGEDSHYSSKEAAYDAYETKMQEKTLTSVSRKPNEVSQRGADYQAKRKFHQAEKQELTLKRLTLDQERIAIFRYSSNEIVRLEDKMNEVEASLNKLAGREDFRGKEKKRKLELEKTALKREREETIQGASKNTAQLRKEINALQEKEDEIDSDLWRMKAREQSGRRFKISDKISYHGDRTRIKAAATGPGKSKEKFVHHSHQSDDINPVDKFIINPSESNASIVILGDVEGNKARAICYSGDHYRENPPGELGRPAVQINKDRHPKAGDAGIKTDNLVVLGYISTEGDAHGWVPDKKIPFFYDAWRGF